MKLRSRSQLLLLVLLFSTPWALRAQDSSEKKQQTNSWAISTEMWSYHSFSQQKPTTPVQAGYPVIEAQSFALGISRGIQNPKAHHNFMLTISIPSSLDADNGRGQNHLLDQNNHTYFRSGLDYNLTFPFFSMGALQVYQGLTSGLLYENRVLHYTSGALEKTADMNLYIGPGLKLQYGLSSEWKLNGTFDGRFYLPYTNYGELHAFDSEGDKVFSSAYSGFYYQTLFELGVSRNLPVDGMLQIGIVKNDLIGFAGREPTFYVNDVVHFKLDRIFHYYIRYHF